jgi:hypothetical protein
MSEQETPRAGRIGPISWELNPERPGHYKIRRDGAPHVTGRSGSYAQVEDMCGDDYRTDQQVEAARASDDPGALCRIGWHQFSEASGRVSFFTFCSGTVGELLHYRLGPRPGHWWTIHIAGVGPDATPWHCSVCEKDFPAED